VTLTAHCICVFVDNTKSGPTIGVTSGESWTKTSEVEDTVDVPTPKVTLAKKVSYFG